MQPLVNKLDAYRVFLSYSGAMSFGFALAFTVNMVYLVEVVGLDALQMVLVGTVLETTAFLLEVPTGIVADVYSRRLSVIIGVVLLGVATVMFGLAHTFALILVTQVISGAGYTFLSGAGDAWLADEIGEAAAGKAYLRSSQVGQVAAIAGIIASVTLASVDLALPIVIAGALLLAVALYLLLFMPEDGFTPTPKAERQAFSQMTGALRDGARAIRGRPVLLTILATIFVYGAFTEGLDRLWTVHILENFSLPALGQFDSVVWFGIIGIVSMTAGTLVTEVARRRINTESGHAIARALIVINVVMIAMIVTFALAQSFALALAAFWVLGPMRGLNYPLKTAWINKGLDPKVRATVLSISAQADAFGQIGGGPGIGYIGRVFGVRTALALGGLILSPVLLLFARTLRQEDAALLANTEAEPEAAL